MKIRSKLIVAFFIMILFPLFAGSICINEIMETQTGTLNEHYNSSKKKYNHYDYVINPVKILYALTSGQYDYLVDIADNSPEKFADERFLKKTNDALMEKESFLVVRCDEKDVYIGCPTDYKKISYLPDFDSYEKGKNNTISIDNDNSLLIRSKTFQCKNNTIGQVYIITDMTRLIPHWQASLRDFIISVFFILLLTACILIFWLYHSIVKPLNILRIATKNIGAGNLDQPVCVTSADEIGELCRDFEEMRIRLHSILRERIQYEEDTRQVMSSISHDLKTPITAIKGYAEGLLDGITDTPEKKKKYLRTIVAKSNDMTYLIEELSLFSQIEQNTLAYNFVPLDIDEYITDCLAKVALDFEIGNIKIDYECEVSAGTLVLADPEQLRRVIYNITGNSAKYMDKEDGHILIRVTNVIPKPAKPPLYRQINKDGTDLVPPKKPDEFIQIEITDNGPGIDKKDLPYIFDEFYRADASRNSSKRGSGLGLAIVQKVISDHGGKLWAGSTPGLGTSIYFTLKKK